MHKSDKFVDDFQLRENGMVNEVNLQAEQAQRNTMCIQEWFKMASGIQNGALQIE